MLRLSTVEVQLTVFWFMKILNDSVENLSRLPEREKKTFQKNFSNRFSQQTRKKEKRLLTLKFCVLRIKSREKLNWFNFIASSVIDGCGRILIYFWTFFWWKLIHAKWSDDARELIINDRKKKSKKNSDFMSRSWIVERKTTFRGITYGCDVLNKKLRQDVKLTFDYFRISPFTYMNRV